jgi:hypothetical protein
MVGLMVLLSTFMSVGTYRKLSLISMPRMVTCCLLAVGISQAVRAQQINPIPSSGTVAHLDGLAIEFDASGQRSKLDSTYLYPVKFPDRRGIAIHSIRPDLRHALQIWQNKLQLADWSVAMEIVDDHALGGVAMGDIRWDLRTKRASIRILREADYDLPAVMARLDQQATVLHELVHLRHASTGDRQDADEASVILQTNALLRANRQWRILAVQEQ